MSPTRWKSQASATALLSGSVSFLTALSFSAIAVKIFTGAGSLIWTLAGCPSGLNGRLM